MWLGVAPSQVYFTGMTDPSSKAVDVIPISGLGGPLVGRGRDVVVVVDVSVVAPESDGEQAARKARTTTSRTRRRLMHINVGPLSICGGQVRQSV